MAPAVLGLSLCLPSEAVAQVVPTTPASPDATSPPAMPLPLDEALQLARRHAPAIRAATTRSAAEAEVADASRAWRHPTVDLSVENLGPQGLDHDGFVWFTQPLDIGARRSTRIAAAQASRDFLARQVDGERRTLDLALVDTYIAVVRTRHVSDLLTAHERALDDVVSLVERRLREGVAAEGDLRKLEAERGRTRIARMRLELERRQHVLTLGFLTGLQDEALAERVRMPAASSIGAADIEAALERRADVRAAEARVEERRTAAAAERALGSTAIAAMGGYKRTGGFNTGTAGVSIDLPIGLRNTPSRLRAEAEAAAAVLELEQARAIARLDIEQALLAARVLTSQAARAGDDLVTPAEIARQAARAAFREGTGDALALVDADRVHLESQREALALQVDAVAARIRARLALGEEPVP